MTKKKKIYRRIIWILAIVFILINIVAIFQAYKFTHFADSSENKTEKPSKLTTLQKVKVLVLGVSNPRPTNKVEPQGNFETITLKSNKTIECWYIRTSRLGTIDSAQGTVIMCHGYSGDKSSLLGKAEIFDSLGFNTFLFDFMGSGGSEGNTTTIGYKEAEEVKTVYDYLKNKKAKDIYLFGTSMGAVAIMRAISKYNLQPKGIILECPFGSMYQTVVNRFDNMNVPAFPMAGLLVFWGGVENGFWAFGHKPIKYAKNINCPTLLMYGLQDKNVSRTKIDKIYDNLKGRKYLNLFPKAGHENYLIKYKQKWTQDVTEFINVTKEGRTANKRLLRQAGKTTSIEIFL